MEALLKRVKGKSKVSPAKKLEQYKTFNTLTRMKKADYILKHGIHHIPKKQLTIFLQEAKEARDYINDRNDKKSIKLHNAISVIIHNRPDIPE